MILIMIAIIMYFHNYSEFFSNDTILNGKNLVFNTTNARQNFSNSLNTINKINNLSLYNGMISYQTTRSPYVSDAEIFERNVTTTINCNDGSWVDKTNINYSCLLCPVGSYCLNAKKYPCNENFYNNIIGSSSCLPCPYGYVSNVGSISCLRPYYIIAITDIIIAEGSLANTFGSNNLDYLGVNVDTPSKTYINGYTLINTVNMQNYNDTNRTSYDAYNVNTGTNSVTLWIKYSLVDRRLSTPVLTNLVINKWEKCTWYGSCSWSEPKCDIGYTSVGRLTSQGSINCYRYGLCKQMTPANTVSTYVSSLAWSKSNRNMSIYTPTYAYNINTLNRTANVICDNVSLINQPINVQTGCINLNYIYLAIGYKVL